MSDHAPSPPETLHECPDCGLFQRVGAMRPDQVAECRRCAAVLRRRRRDSLTTTFALSLTGLVLFAIGAGAMLLSFRLAGRQAETSLAALPSGFAGAAFLPLAAAVAFSTLAAPALRLALTVAVLGGLRLRGVPRRLLVGMARLRHLLRPWAMVEVFLLGLFVAYTRLAALASVEVGLAVYALGAVMLVSAWADSWLDEHAMWEAIAAYGAGPPPPPARTGRRLGCDVCGQVTVAAEGEPCPRCGARLRHRKPAAFARPWALLLTGAMLYAPANAYPVMTVIRLGQGHPSTILGGVRELIEYRMWPLAGLVFVASIVVPMLKLLGMGYLLVSTQRSSAANLLGRTRVFRLVDLIGRWSMIDIFMMAILVSLVRMGALASVTPGVGAVAFCAVVLLTMISALTFDPRLIWDRAAATADDPPAQLAAGDAAGGDAAGSVRA